MSKLLVTTLTSSPLTRRSTMPGETRGRTPETLEDEADELSTASLQPSSPAGKQRRQNAAAEQTA